MSFSIVTKDELARVMGSNECCREAELAALIKTNGNLLPVKDNQVVLAINTESAALARKNFLLLKENFQIYAHIQVKRKRRLRKNNIYIVKVSSPADASRVLERLKILDSKNQFKDEIPGWLVRKECCRRAYLRGLFLGSGSINNPSSNYHLEISCAGENYGKDICRLLRRFNLHPGLIARKNGFVAYLKEGGQIADCLNIIGAHTALLDMENIRVYKGMRNQVNRLVNCETANLGKTVNASLNQLETIKFIASTIGIGKLPLPLRQVASARLAYPDVSLRELGELIEPKIGKSGVRYRLERLEDIAQQYLMNQEVVSLEKKIPR
ncbi:MAG: DNA-binding protein WhiA [Eubacteriales bacterium]|jgi:hypothetical protein